ncbi:Protein of unknown function [Gryllus bimaculatus]|nr:Protein of unknown function [Gryllus bimaculatus]
MLGCLASTARCARGGSPAQQEMAWEALRRQPPPSQDLLNDMHFDDPHRLYWRVPSIPEQLNLISDDVEESPPEVGSVMQ